MLRSPLFWQLAGSQTGLVLLSATLPGLAGPVAPLLVAGALAAALGHALWLARRARALDQFAAALSARKPLPPLPAVGRDELATLAGTLAQLAAQRSEPGAGPPPTSQPLRADHLAILSHEMRTPLNGIMGMTQLALQTPLSPEQREYLDVVQNSSDFLLSVINDLADPARLETGAVELQCVRFDLREVLSETLKLVALRAHQKGLELAGAVAAAVPAAMDGDPYRLRQLLLNLLGNAIHFTERGEVVVAVTLAAGAAPGSAALHFRIADTGVGIAPERQAHLFDDWSRLPAGGRGLGLVMARGLVQRMGGRIWVESTPAVGSTFHFTMPLLAPAAALTPWAPVVPPGLAGRGVLVVEDNATYRGLLGDWLTGWGLRPVLAGEPAAALAAAQAAAARGERPAFALVDAGLGGHDGFACAEALRREAGSSALPVIMLIAAHQPAEAARCRALALADPLIKPFGPADLLAAAAQALGVSRPAAPAHAPRLAPPPPRLRVLLAEANPLQRQLAVLLLEKLGHEVILAATGQEVLAAVAEKPIDVLLLDPQLGDPDGRAAAAAIRAAEHGTARHLPIIALIGYGRTDERDQCRAAGMDLHVAKPLHVQELVRAIESLVSPAEPRR